MSSFRLLPFSSLLFSFLFLLLVFSNLSLLIIRSFLKDSFFIFPSGEYQPCWWWCHLKLSGCSSLWHLFDFDQLNQRFPFLSMENSLHGRDIFCTFSFLDLILGLFLAYFYIILAIDENYLNGSSIFTSFFWFFSMRWD